MTKKVYLAIATALLIAGCCNTAGLPAMDFVPVRQAQFRAPACAAAIHCQPANTTYALPLDAAGRAALIMFLAAGGNNDNIEDGALTTIVDPDAEEQWGELLTSLQNAANVDVAALTNGTFAKWFQGAPVRQVVDARDDRPPLSCSPYVLRKDRYEWIFTCGTPGKLGGVLVQLAPAARMEK